MDKNNYYLNVSKIDRIIQQGLIIDDIFTLINQSEYGNYFFSKINDLRWFHPLKNKGYFSPQNIPWNVLPYLERISKNITSTENKEYIAELLSIIDSLTKYKNTEELNINNNQMWWYFVKILINLPTESIKYENLNKWLPIWLSSRYDTTLQGRDLALGLLPKFLLSDAPEDIKKAELILEQILSFKENKPTHSLKERKVQKLVLEYYWIEELLEKYEKDLGEKCSKEFILRISENIKQLLIEDHSEIAFDLDKGTYVFSIDNMSDVQIFRTKYSDLPREKLTEMAWTNKEKEIPWKNCSNEIRLTNISYNSIDIILGEMKKDTSLKEILTIKGEEYIRQQIYWLITKIYDSGTYNSFYLTGNPQFNTLDLFTDILKRLLNYKAISEIEETKNILEKYLNDQYMYFKKMALYVMGLNSSNMQNYKDIYIKHLREDKYSLLLDGILFGDELKHLLNNFIELNENEKQLFKDKISAGCILHSRTDDEESKIWKQERYKALSHIPEFKMLHDDIQSKTYKKVELRPAVSEVHSGFVEHTSPKSHDELLKMSVEEVVKYINEVYRPPEEREFLKIEGVEGLAGELSKAIEKDPKKFIDKLYLFQSTGYYYIYVLIGTLRTLWKNKADLDLDKILSFIKNYISADDFGSEKLIIQQDGWNADALWIIGIIGEFIQDGTRNDEWALEEQYLGKIKDILFACLDMLIPSEKPRISDPVTDALNTFQGKIIRALIFYSLRITRLNENKFGKKEVNLENDVKEKYEIVLNRKILDAYTLFGQYLPQLTYLDKSWAYKNIKEFESLYDKDIPLWECFITGYLFSGNVYSHIFEQMTNHYLLALKHEFNNTQAANELIDHITIGYFRNIKNGKELFDKFITDWKPIQVEAFIKFVWSQAAYILNDVADDNEKEVKIGMIIKIKQFWQFVYNKYKDKTDLSKEEGVVLANMCLIISYLTPIDEINKEWIKLSIKYVDDNFSLTQFIEALNKIKNTGDPIKIAAYIGEIFNTMLEFAKSMYPYEKIEDIIKFLYDNKQKELADNICNTYGRRGIDNFRKLWESNNSEENVGRS